MTSAARREAMPGVLRDEKQGERLRRLNEIAIRQMQVLTIAPALKQIKE